MLGSPPQKKITDLAHYFLGGAQLHPQRIKIKMSFWGSWFEPPPPSPIRLCSSGSWAGQEALTSNSNGQKAAGALLRRPQHHPPCRRTCRPVTVPACSRRAVQIPTDTVTAGVHGPRVHCARRPVYMHGTAEPTDCSRRHVGTVTASSGACRPDAMDTAQLLFERQR